MNEGFRLRVGRLVSGSFNALVDAVENAAPEVVMAEAIREIDSAIEEVRADLGRLISGRHLAHRRLIDEDRKLQELASKIELAVAEGRDDLAESAIARQLDIEAQIPVLEASVSESTAREQELDGYLQALQARKREMREELTELEARRNQLPGSGTSGSCAPGTSNVDAQVGRATEAFERALGKHSGLPARGSGIDRESVAALAELDTLARSNRVRERLAAIKARGRDS